MAADLTLPHCPPEQRCLLCRPKDGALTPQLPALGAASPQQLDYKLLQMRIPRHRKGGSSLKVTQSGGSRGGVQTQGGLHTLY